MEKMQTIKFLAEQYQATTDESQKSIILELVRQVFQDKTYSLS